MGFFDSLKCNQVGKKAYRLHLMGMQLRKQGKYAESEEKLRAAIELYDEAYKLGFRRPGALQGYALLLMRRGKFEQAREIMLECSKDKTLKPEDRFALRVDFSICQWKMGQLDKAIETIEQAAEVKKNGLIYTTMGMYLVDKARQTGDFEAAIKLNEEAMEYDDEDVGVWDNMGQMYLAMSEFSRKAGDAKQAAEQRQKACEYFKKCYDEKPEQVSSTYFYAKVMHEDGYDDIAREAIEKAMKVPYSAMLQVSTKELEALKKEIR